jgi:ribonuclease BN (tRNA processing enzyme)
MTPVEQYLIDCGASAMISINRFGVDSDAIGTILLTHLHGDHFGGIPAFLLDAHLAKKRSRPLLVAGPPGTRVRLDAARDILYPGSAAMRLSFPLDILELRPEQPHRLGGITVTPFPVEHPSGAPPFALRLETAGKTLAYSGDTEWTDALIPVSRGADLFIVECNFYDRNVRYHLDLQTLLAHRDHLQAKRLILTHLGPEMLAHLDALPYEYAEDGKTITI